MIRALLSVGVPLLLALLTGCASGPNFTVDDGRKVDESLLAGMRAYGAGERLLRPAIARSAALQDYTRLAPPNTPQLQDYHWLLNLHPLEVTGAEPAPDEALWMVLWTQGLSEEGGARMKTYHYAVKIAGTLYNLATPASGVKAAALAADAAITAARSAAANVATEFLKQQLIKQGSRWRWPSCAKA
jgi:hypothetical protein